MNQLTILLIHFSYGFYSLSTGNAYIAQAICEIHYILYNNISSLIKYRPNNHDRWGPIKLYIKAKVSLSPALGLGEKTH